MSYDYYSYMRNLARLALRIIKYFSTLTLCFYVGYYINMVELNMTEGNHDLLEEHACMHATT